MPLAPVWVVDLELVTTMKAFLSGWRFPKNGLCRWKRDGPSRKWLKKIQQAFEIFSSRQDGALKVTLQFPGSGKT